MQNVIATKIMECGKCEKFKYLHTDIILLLSEVSDFCTDFAFQGF